jgi:hypothetical protein
MLGRLPFRVLVFTSLGCAAMIIGACGAFSGSSDDAAAATPTPDAASDAVSAETAPVVDAGSSHCAEGQRATLLASGGAHALASDERGTYWADVVDSGAFLNVVAQDGGARFPADSPEISFIQPQVATVTYVGHNPDDFCWMRQYDRGSGAIGPANVGTGCASGFYAGDLTGLFAAHLLPYDPQFTLTRLAPMSGSLKLAQPGKPAFMLSDGVWVYVVFTDTSGYSAIWRYTFSDPPQNLTQTAGARGPMALWNDKLVWVTSSGGIRSMATTGGDITDHVTVPGAKTIAVGGDCVYVATGAEVIAVDPAAGWTTTPVANAISVELSASRAGVFWTTSTGGVEALWH